MVPPDSTRSPIRYIKPLGPRVLVRITKLDDRTDSGLYLPDGVKEEHDEALYGQVLEVARTEIDAEARSLGENVSGVPLGAHVLFPKKEGLRVPWDEDLRLLEVKSVYAVVEEVAETEIQ